MYLKHIFKMRAGRRRKLYLFQTHEEFDSSGKSDVYNNVFYLSAAGTHLRVDKVSAVTGVEIDSIFFIQTFSAVMTDVLCKQMIVLHSEPPKCIPHAGILPKRVSRHSFYADNFETSFS